MASLAEEIQREVQTSSSRTPVILVPMKWEDFDDTSLKAFIPNVHTLRGKDVMFLACFDSGKAIVDQLSVIYALPKYGVRSLTVVLPYFPGTMDRAQRPGEIVTAMTLARMLSAIPPCFNGGPAQIVIYDIHDLREWHYFGDSVVVRLESAIPLLCQTLPDKNRAHTIAIAFPDDGARKRFAHMFEGYPHIICDKIRQGDERIVTIREGNPHGMHVIIFDDLVMSGGTILECTKALFKAGALTVGAKVSHGIFPKYSWKKFLDAGLDSFEITNSFPRTARAVQGKGPFAVVSLAPSITHIILES